MQLRWTKQARRQTTTERLRTPSPNPLPPPSSSQSSSQRTRTTGSSRSSNAEGPLTPSASWRCPPRDASAVAAAMAPSNPGVVVVVTAPSDPPGLSAVIATDALPYHGLGGPGAGVNPATSITVVDGHTTTMMVANPMPAADEAPPPRPQPSPTTPTTIQCTDPDPNAPAPDDTAVTTPSASDAAPRSLPGMAHPPTTSTGLDRHGTAARIKHRTRAPGPWRPRHGGTPHSVRRCRQDDAGNCRS